MSENNTKIEAVIFDWAGTVVDHGCWAPVLVFINVFHDRGIEVPLGIVRSGMGMAKRKHIQTILYSEKVSEDWAERFGKGPTEADVDLLYRDFLGQLGKGILEYSEMIEGAAEVMKWLKARGIRIGSTTGYPREMMTELIPRAAAKGFDPEIILTASDVAVGRPAPWMIYRICEAFDLFPLKKVIKVDDTVTGIEAGRNAGCWTIGVSCTGNLMGLSELAFRELDAEEREKKREEAIHQLEEAGADLVIDSVAELPEAIGWLEERMKEGRV